MRKPTRIARHEPQNDIHKTNATSTHGRQFQSYEYLMRSVNIGPAIAGPTMPAPGPLKYANFLASIILFFYAKKICLLFKYYHLLFKQYSNNIFTRTHNKTIVTVTIVILEYY